MAQNWRPNLIGVMPQEAVRAINRLYDAVSEHDRAIVAVNAKTTAMTRSAAATATASAVPAAATGSATANALVLGNVNKQSASYTLEDGDYGGLVVFNVAFALTCTLNANLKPMFFTTIENLGPAAVTLTPQTGAVNGQASLVLVAQASTAVFFDGQNWWSTTEPPTYLRGSGTIQCGGAVSGSFSVDVPVPGATPAMLATATLPAGANPNASVIQGGWLDAGVTAAGMARVRLVIPAGGTAAYNAVQVGVVVYA